MADAKNQVSASGAESAAPAIANLSAQLVKGLGIEHRTQTAEKIGWRAAKIITVHGRSHLSRFPVRHQTNPGSLASLQVAAQ
jgi:hypothetical protein